MSDGKLESGTNKTESVANSHQKNPTAHSSLDPTVTKETPGTNATENTEHQKAPPALTPIEKLVKSLILGDDLKETSPTIKLGYTGLKTAKDVEAFIRSPAGKELITEIGTQLAIEQSIKDEQQFQAREHEALKHRLQAAFFLWMAGKKAYSAHKRNDLIAEQNAQHIKEAKASKSANKAQADKSTFSSSDTQLLKALDDYTKALAQNMNKHTELKEQEKSLEQQLEKLDVQEHMIDFKYDVYHAALNDFDNVLEKFEQSPDTVTDAEIQTHIDMIKAKMDEQLDEIDELIKDNKDGDAEILMKMNTALNFQLASHFDMLAVRSGKKYYADEQGNLVKSFKDAHFVMDTHDDNSQGAIQELSHSHSRIYKDEYNNHYLLKPGQTWDSIKDNTAEKAQAHKDFNQRKHEFMVVKKVVTLTHGLEATAHKERVEDVKAQIKDNKAEQMLLLNQNTLIQSARASAENIQQNPHITTPVPRPTITSGAPTMPKPSQSSATKSYRDKIEEVRQLHQVTQQDLLALASQAPGPQKIAARNFLQSEFVNLPRNAPIPFTTMQSLLKNLERFGIDATKPGVTNLRSPLELQRDASVAPEENKHPSPLSTSPSPSPFKK